MLEKTELIDLIELFRESSLAELEIWEGTRRFRLLRHGPGEARATPSSAAPPMGAGEPASGRAAGRDPGHHPVLAGMAGQFHRAPGPGERPFVELGSRVAAGATLGLMEAMKMLVPIEAEYTGTIAAIAAEDGAEVAAGAVLMTIEIES